VTRVLGLDLSIAATGICTPTAGLSTFRPTSQGDARLVEIRNRTVADLFGVDLVAIEGPFVSMSASTLPLLMLHGAIRCALISNHTPYLIVPPATLKIYATGSGKATKADMRMELYKRTTRTDPYDTDEYRTHGGLDVADDNQTDAWWLRALALDLTGCPVVSLPQTHRRALDKLALPKGIT
jgi:hypothetical protein